MKDSENSETDSVGRTRGRVISKMLSEYCEDCQERFENIKKLCPFCSREGLGVCEKRSGKKGAWFCRNCKEKRQAIAMSCGACREYKEMLERNLTFGKSAKRTEFRLNFEVEEEGLDSHWAFDKMTESRNLMIKIPGAEDKDLDKSEGIMFSSRFV